MYLVVRNAGQSGELRLEGMLLRRDATELKVYLQRAMQYVADLTVDCTGVTVVDSACLQLLCSAYRLSRGESRGFVPKGHVPEVFQKAAQTTNFSHCVGCGLENERGCIWGIN